VCGCDADEDTPNLTLYVNEVALPKLQLHGEATIQMQYNAAAIKVTFAQVQTDRQTHNIAFKCHSCCVLSFVCFVSLFVLVSLCCFSVPRFHLLPFSLLLLGYCVIAAIAAIGWLCAFF